MGAIERANEESKQFARQWRRQLFRNSVSILLGALLLFGFSPSNVMEYIASFLVIIPLLLWAQEYPKNTKHRSVVIIIFLVSAAAIYFGVIYGS
jgi:apolipoprotein N-acyltransferase